MEDMKILDIGGGSFEIADAEARAYIAQLQTDITALRAAVGSPLQASTKSGMTDKTKVYVYTGSETGMTSGNWYYWNGNDWTSGGVYNSQALETDTTLAIAGMAADSKKVGDEIADIKSAINSLSLGIDENDELVYVYVNGVKQGEGIEMGGGGTRYDVTYSLIHATSSSTAGKVYEGRTYTTTITPDTGYIINSVSVSMGGVNLPNAYNESTGVITVENVSGNIVISVVTEIEPIDLLNVTWANHAITCGQSTNNYNAWSPHNLQYDDVRDEFVFLQCHCDKHLNQTYTNWTLSVINPYDATDVEDITIPTFNGLGMLFIENGTWTLLPRGGSSIYQSTDRGVTWDTISASVPSYIFGVYKCGDKYFAGNDSNTEITYYESTDLINWTTKSFDSTLGYSILCETTFCEFDGKYWAFNRTNDSTLGHPVILTSTDQGATWTLFSDQLLHGYRSTVSCYPFENYIMIADIDRDGGVIYYSKFDGTVITELNTWVLPCGGDDFHNINLTSNYRDAVIIEFMFAVPAARGVGTTNIYYHQLACDNVMLVGSTNALPSLQFTAVASTNNEILTFAQQNLTVGVKSGDTYAWQQAYGGAAPRITGSNLITTFVDEIELPLNVFQNQLVTARCMVYFKNGDSVIIPWNNIINNPMYASGSAWRQTSQLALVEINGSYFEYGVGKNLATLTLPVLTKVNNLVEATQADTVSGTDNQITKESWQTSLGLRRVISINEKNNSTHLSPFQNGTVLTRMDYIPANNS